VRAAARPAWLIGLRSLSVSPRVLTRFVVVGLLVLIGIGTLTALGAYRLSFAAPPWWRTVDATDPATIELAERTEQAMTSALHRKRELGEPWTVALSAPQANAWMNVMLPRWLENREVDRPAWTSEVQLHFEEGEIAAGAMVTDERGRERYVTLRVEPMVDDAGAVWLRPRGASVGRLDAPLRWTFEELERRATPETDELVAGILGRAPVAAEAVVELGDGRIVRVVGARVRDHRLLVTCVTER
jgi:hypothetical protein